MLVKVVLGEVEGGRIKEAACRHGIELGNGNTLRPLGVLLV
jgi:hypothetical protein